MPDKFKQSFKFTIIDNFELSIYNCGLQRCASGYSWGPGIRDHYLMHYVTRGKGTFIVNGTTYDVKSGDVFFAKPSQLISYTSDVDDPWEYYWVGFNGSTANKLVSQLPFMSDMPVHSCRDIYGIQEAISNIFLSRGPDNFSEVLMTGHLYIFIAHLMIENNTNDSSKLNSSGSIYVVNAIKFIQFNYSHVMNIDDIAKAVGVSRSHLYRVFMSNIGESPIDYLTSYRINESCQLLESGKYSISEIAMSVGFFDQFYFSRVFKKIMGVPPSKYVATKTIVVNETEEREN